MANESDDVPSDGGEKPQKSNRLLIRITRENLPQVKDKYPFLYLERGRLEIDDSSVKWIDCDKNVVRLPIATINCLLLGPGTTITHEAVKVVAQSNCSLCWVGEDTLIFYAAGQSPSANTRNLRMQMRLSADPKKSVEVARRMFKLRFPDADLTGKTLKEMMGMEGHRVRSLYEKKAQEYQVGWKGRSFVPGKFQMGDLTNQILTSCNAALYGILSSAIYSMGYSPHVGFIHSGSPLPFVYDMADLYKEIVSIDLAFSLTQEMAGQYNRQKVSTAFRERVIQDDILGRIGADIDKILETKKCSL
ncbi:type I-E CRISPR-associated endonuclease Cas1e [Acidithiobacillus thiooxidans]|uniref:CRISPR-associated endonuclease Cas1 n=1 Tax=Acidithiobacillus thiooxidans TaxID=930 RepID=A0A1C2I6F9_ACITH|nr:type I-E CRISPR-associated endonuclease Cas1e [Acidithiobacillus thiooxidans]OCX71579.1 subtype I-E CRISPR-associated endonuclease Cas1 [Acidithiobacillus thiooxidans]OCX85971.1 subtype I-E CRISPR-associated endonuclease Cas1 [Acidithiobacillus thiooxidans]